MLKKTKKEDMNYAARIADGESLGSNNPPRVKKKCKFRNLVSQNTGGVVRPFFEETLPVSKMIDKFLEEMEILREGIDPGIQLTANRMGATDEDLEAAGEITSATENTVIKMKKNKKKKNN